MRTQIQTPNPRRVFVDLDSYDRIRQHSPAHLNQQVQQGIEECVRVYGAKDKQAISEHISELDREWDLDRATMLFFASAASIALVMGLARNKKWFALQAVQLSFLAYHAAKGWCPPAALLRRFGFRSFKEIDAEKYALKTLRGDFAP